MSNKRKKKQAAQRRAQSQQQHQTKQTADPQKKPTGRSTPRWLWPAVAGILVVAALVVAGALVRPSLSKPTGPWTLTILHTTDVAGYIDPCG